MTDLRTAAHQMLEALEGGVDSWRLIGPAIDALRAALAEEALQRLTDANQEIEAALEQPEPDRPTIEQMMAVIGENQRLRAELKFGSAEPEQEKS